MRKREVDVLREALRQIARNLISLRKDKECTGEFWSGCKAAYRDIYYELIQTYREYSR